MTPERRRRAFEVFDAALQHAEAERSAFVESVCADDDDLARAIHSLLLAHQSASGFASAPIMSASSALAVADVFGPYRIDSLLGRGGMGVVYQARDTTLNRDVALKILPFTVSLDSDRVARFKREAQFLASINHPNIAAIYGFVEHDGIQALVLELVQGETLADRIARGPIPLNDALTIARQIADALDAAHEKGVVHRDLKPANVKVRQDGTLKVLDFGLAKSMTGDGLATDLTQSPTVTGGPTREGMILGTAPYMSPEQARGLAVDKRTDIWAFGCVLYEMLTGHAAFARQTTSDTIAAILERNPDWRALPVGIPPTIGHLLRRCLEKDPKRRLRDVGDARTDLELPPPSSSSADTRDRSRPAYVLWSLLALGAVGLGFAAWTLARNVTPIDVPRIIRTTRVTDTPAQEFGPAISADGKLIAYYSDIRGVTDLWVKSLDNGTTRNLTESLDLELQVRASMGGIDIRPDGAEIAFTARQRSDKAPGFDTWVIPAPFGGQPLKRLTGLQGMRWSPDGKRLVAMKPGSFRGDELFVADADSENQRVIVPLSGGRHVHWPAWSRDGAFIYFVCTFIGTQEEPTELCRVPSDGRGPVETVVTTERRAMNAAPAPDGSLLFSANPASLDAGLWWRPKNGGAAVPLTGGIGEYLDTYLSRDGSRAVATWLDVRQSLVEILVRSGGANEPRRMTEGYSGERYPQLDPVGRRLAFSSTRGGARTLWLARPDASQATRLTGGDAIDDRPAFSPDGSRIAFVSGRGGRQAIWVVSVDSGTPRRVGEAIVLDTLTWSPDGKRIVFATSGDQLPRLVSMSVDNGRIEPLEGMSGHAPSWSPSTNRLAYLQVEEPPEISPRVRTTLVIVEGGQHHRYPIAALLQGFSNGLTAWSPDGRRVALVAAQSNLRNTIWIFDPDSRDQFRQLAELPVTVSVRGITWSPDASSLIVAQQETKSDIVLFDLASARQ